MSKDFNLQPNLSDELRFLVNCCKADPSDNDVKEILSYLNTPDLDMSTLISLANQHGVLPLVYKTIKNLSQGDDLNAKHLTLNAEILTELKAHYMSISQRNMLMSAELIRIMKLFEENNIEALAFKGPSLSYMAYGDITLRQFSDLDILIKKKDLYLIENILNKLDYQRIYELTPSQEKVWIDHAKDIALYHQNSGVHLEMHWALLENDYPMQINLDTIWNDTQTISINGKEIKTFENEDLLIYLCIHGSIHLYERIEWIKDIDLLISSQNIDWTEIEKKVSGSGFEMMFYLGLILSRQLFNTELPTFILKNLDQEKNLAPITTYILNSWQNQNLNTINEMMEQVNIKLKLFSGFREKISYLHKIILKPTFNEYWFIDLPKGLYWFYYLVRPYLLLKKYFSKQS